MSAGAALVALAVAALIASLALAGGAPAPAPAGLPDAGLLTGWALPVTRLAFDLTAVAAVGSLLVGAVLLDGGSRAQAAVRLGGAWSAAWALTAVALLLLSVSETVGVPVSGLSAAQVGEQATTGRGRALLVVVVLTAAVALGTRAARTVAQARALLGGALLALLPTTLTGHAASAADHDLATTSLVVHVVAATLWVGGLVGVLAHLRRDPAALRVAVPRFSVLALAAVAALALSGLLNAVTRLGLDPTTWASGYGALVLGKTGALVVLVVMGAAHRSRLVPALAAGRPRAFLRLAAVEVAVMAAVTGVAVALSRTPTPALPVAPAQPAHGAGHETLPTAIEPVSLANLLTAWRLDALEITAIGLALALYVAGVRALRRAGEPWPLARSAAFLAGTAVALLALCSGIATYAPALVSVQVGQLLLVLLVVPALLLLGAPLTLWLRVRALRSPGGTGDPVPPLLRSPVVRAAADPFTGAVLVAALLFAVYRTPLIEASLRGFGVHLLVNVLALAGGLLLLWPVLGVDPVPVPRPRLERLLPLAAVVTCLALLAGQLRYGDELLAGQWFLELRWNWVDPVADQRLAGLLVALAAVALPLLVLLGRPTAHALPEPEPVAQRPARKA